MRSDPPLALSIGDPSGVGPEIAIAAWRMRDSHDVPPFYLLGDPALIETRAGRLGVSLAVEECAPGDAAGLFARALPVVALDNRLVDSPGQPQAVNAAGVIEAIDRAVADCLEGRAALPPEQQAMIKPRQPAPRPAAGAQPAADPNLNPAPAPTVV